MMLQDRTLTCRDCGQEFVFTSGEQEFYQSRGLMNEPGRCPDCRRARKQSAGGGDGHRSAGGGYDRPRRETFPAVCSQCGKETTVPFRPTQGRPVYCRECYQHRRAAGAGAAAAY